MTKEGFEQQRMLEAAYAALAVEEALVQELSSRCFGNGVMLSILQAREVSEERRKSLLTIIDRLERKAA